MLHSLHSGDTIGSGTYVACSVLQTLYSVFPGFLPRVCQGSRGVVQNDWFSKIYDSYEAAQYSGIASASYSARSALGVARKSSMVPSMHGFSAHHAPLLFLPPLAVSSTQDMRGPANSRVIMCQQLHWIGVVIVAPLPGHAARN